MVAAVTGAAGPAGAGSELLRQRLRQLERRSRLRAFLLVAPLLLFVIVSFVLPIGEILFRSVDNRQPCALIPRSCAALAQWDGKGVPDEALFAGLAAELVQLNKDRTIGQLGSHLNYEASGMLSLMRGTARQLGQVKEGPYKPAFIAIDPAWGSHETWGTVKQALRPYTLSFFLHAVDHRYDADGNIVAEAPDQRIYLTIFTRTLWIALLVTGLCLVAGYAVAYWLAHLPAQRSNLLLILVLLPFWTSLLVRTTSWIVLLQSSGVVNDLLVWVGLTDDAHRLQLVYNRTGTLVAMTHILLPFMILPIYSVMKTIPPAYELAARSLGAHIGIAFRRVYLPLTLPGVAAGSLLVFILAIGYYITPALVGGQSGQLISNLIAYHMQSSLNWSLAAALSTCLLVVVIALYWVYSRLIGFENIRLG